MSVSSMSVSAISVATSIAMSVASCRVLSVSVAMGVECQL